ncbi:MAG TPA: transcription antitermination factor NusB [Chitinophagaceae bacterium]|nr:transcription antitermination factor NusB [Chitinophagaceae bacterium]
MISRRNIRVKVMQTLYTISNLDNDSEALRGKLQPQKILDNHFKQTSSLLSYLTWFLSEVARYAETDAHQRASKHLPTAEDMQVNTKISGNELLWKMLEDESLQKQMAADKPAMLYQQSDEKDNDLIRKIYVQLSNSAEYKNYIATGSREKASEKAILDYILNDLLLANESFTSHIEDLFSNWEDDGEMIVQLLVGFMQKPGSLDFQHLLGADKEQFARKLLQTVLEKSEHLQTLIIPKLKNWDPERIAHLDMILMKMGVAEFLYFETIPPKVTINEYIDLAKDYSTAQSGQFVNGILDNIHKELVQDGKMQKSEYKKQ